MGTDTASARRRTRHDGTGTPATLVVGTARPPAGPVTSGPVAPRPSGTSSTTGHAPAAGRSAASNARAPMPLATPVVSAPYAGTAKAP